MFGPKIFFPYRRASEQSDRPARPYVPEDLVRKMNDIARLYGVRHPEEGIYQKENAEAYDIISAQFDKYVERRFSRKNKSVKMSSFALLHQAKNKYGTSYYYKRVNADSHEDRKVGED